MELYLFLLAVAAIFAVIGSYRQGFRHGVQVSLHEPTEMSRMKKTRVSSAEYEEPEELRKLRIELENIEHYGTDVPQQEVQ
jgi:hypothetical protein